MRMISIAFKDLLITLKDKKAMAMIILMPLILIFVLGSALSSNFSAGEGIKKFDIALVDQDGGEFAEEFKTFLKEENIQKFIGVQQLDYDEAEEKVKSGELPTMIVLPKGYSKAVKEGSEINIKIVQDPGSNFKNNIVESIVKSYTGVLSSITAASESADSVFKNYNLDGRMILPEVLKAIEANGDSQLKESNLESSNQVVSSMQYYAAAMLVMYVLFVGMIGTTSIIQEREEKTLERLMGTTVSKASIVSGKLLGLFLIGVLDVSVLIAFTKYIYKADWGNSIPGVIVLSAATLLAACGLAMFIATIFKTSKAVDSVVPAGIMVLSFLGGSMFPIYAMPQTLQTVAKITPNNWALRGYINLMLNNGFSSIVTPTLVLTGIGTVLLIAGISRLKLQ
jgi:ABC-2 type transport system permease protein